jgi:hypothetical protein
VFSVPLNCPNISPKKKLKPILCDRNKQFGNFNRFFKQMSEMENFVSYYIEGVTTLTVCCIGLVINAAAIVMLLRYEDESATFKATKLIIEVFKQIIKWST